MPTGDQRYHQPRVEVIERLMMKHGFTRESLAQKAGTSINTLRKRLNGEPAPMCTFKKLATALKTTPDVIIEGYDAAPDVLEPPPPRTQADVVIGKNFSDFDEGQELQELIARFKKLVRAKFKVVVIAIDDGSVRLGLNMAMDDLLRLVDAFAARRLDEVGITAIRLPDSSRTHRRVNSRAKRRSRILNTIIAALLLIAVMPSAFGFAIAPQGGAMTLPICAAAIAFLLRVFVDTRPAFTSQVNERGELELSRPKSSDPPRQ